MSKELEVKSQGFSYGVRWIGGGEIPQDLSGLFTSQKKAEEAIDHYLTTRRVRKPKDAKRKPREK